MRISVVPEELRGFGSRISGVGQDVTATRGVLMGSVRGAGAATGSPEAAGAFEDMCSAWSDALGRSGAAITGTGAAINAAAAIYALVDSSVMPLLGGD